MKHHSGTVAKERLRLMMNAEKNRLDEDTLWQIRTEIGTVITKYVNVDPDNVEVRVLLKDYTKRD
jgi:cell division topological specificity factor